MSDQPDLSDLSSKPLSTRLRGYWRLTGPGYLQSAMTLGGGSVAACVLFGSLMGYELLWVQPLAMALGYFVLAAIAKQVCHSGERPYATIWKRLHPALAVLWAVCALVSTLIWHFPQYSLAATGVIELGRAGGADLDTTAGIVVIGALLLAGACGVVHLYNAGSRGRL